MEIKKIQDYSDVAVTNLDPEKAKIVKERGVELQRLRKQVDVAIKKAEELGRNDMVKRLEARGQQLDTLLRGKTFKELSDGGQFEAFKKQLMEEINELHIDGMPKVEKLNALVGKYVNLEYRLPSGISVKFLDDQTTYLGNQLESEFDGERCFGVIANMEFIMICTYGLDGENPELILYKKR